MALLIPIAGRWLVVCLSPAEGNGCFAHPCGCCDMGNVLSATLFTQAWPAAQQLVISQGGRGVSLLHFFACFGVFFASPTWNKIS